MFYAALLKEHIARAVDLLTDMVFHSTYPQAEIDKEIEVICDEIECYNDSPAELIYDEFENAIFSGHPLGHNILGRAERLREYTTDNALSFTRRFYRPENAVFFAYGDISFSRLVRLLEKATADFPPCSPLVDSVPKGVLPEYNPQELLRHKNTHQAHVMIGNRAYSVHDNRRMALYLLNNILGGPGMNARLNIALREKHGLVYTVDSSMVSYSDTGMWCAYFGCDPKDVKKCRRLVMRELDRMAQKPCRSAACSSQEADKGTDRCGVRQPRELRPRLRKEFPALWLGERRHGADEPDRPSDRRRAAGRGCRGVLQGQAHGAYIRLIRAGLIAVCCVYVTP